ncbi:MAG: T9SS type A sorting domain-containing protein [Bacteroidota bacterium]
MNKKIHLHFKNSCVIVMLALLFSFSFESNAQNMYSLANWTVGTGSITDFSQYGVASCNARELGNNHVGASVVLWKATPNAASFQDGGIYGYYKTIDPTKTYRLSIWVKKTNSFSGKTYFGCNSYANGAHQTLNISGTADINAYFWYGDLPELDKWYLMVGYVHPNSYAGPHLGRIYDGETGEIVMNINDKKFSLAATNLRLRSFFAYDTNLEDRQYLYKPIMEEYSNASPSINSLLSINEDSTLLFAYDNAGNQKQRFYCDVSGCSVQTPPAGRPGNLEIEKVVDVTDDEEVSNIGETIQLYPNPTGGKLSIRLLESDVELSESIHMYSIQGSLIRQIRTEKDTTSLTLDISEIPTGVYFIHLHFSNGNAVTKKIIKR